MAVDRQLSLPIKTQTGGFYSGFSKIVVLGAKLIIGIIVLWAIVTPESAGIVLNEVQSWSTRVFGLWYVWVSAFYMITCIGLALWPKSARIKLGGPNEKPEFSRFSWFSMMFGAGLGVGMLTYSTAEPIFHFANNPDVIKYAFDPANYPQVEALKENNVRSAYKWAFLHYGLTPWACYGIVGMAMGYFSYNRGLPLTIRSALYPLFGRHLSGPLGHIVDIVAILATVIGVGVTIGYGVSQFASGMFNITGFDWIAGEDGKPTLMAQLLALAVIMGASTISAMSGVEKGIKWLSNLNMGLSFFLLAFFVVFGAAAFAFKTYFIAIWDYLLALPSMSFTVWSGDKDTMGGALGAWQGAWSIFYWAWWIAFAPFVGMFLARVSKGRTVREYVLGAIIVPSLMCLVWFALVGGTAVHLELTGVANGSIVNADISAQLFQTVNLVLSSFWAKVMSAVIVILLLTYLITSADSAVLVVNTISSAGDTRQKHTKHIIIWGMIFALVVASLLIAGGMGALRSAMIIGALPFSLVMALMTVSIIKGLVFDEN